MLNRTIAPDIKDPVHFDFRLPDCHQITLNNGIPVYWIKAGNIEVAEIDWVFPAGIWEEPKTAVAHAVAALLRNGTHKYNAAAINEMIESCGATLKISADNDHAVMSLFTMVKHLPRLLPVVREILENALFPQDEVAIYRQRGLQQLKVSLEKSEFIGNRLIDAAVFGKQFPYGRYTEAADLENLNQELLAHYAHHHYGADHCRIFAAGKISHNELTLIADYFGGEKWNPGFTPAPPSDKKPGTERQVRIQQHQGAVQGAVRLACEFPRYDHPDFVPMSVLNTVLGGYFGSRLMSNIREDKGYTYGIYSGIYGFEHGSEMLVSTEAGADVCEATIVEVYREMQRLREDRIPEEELLLVKNYMLGGLLGDLDGPFNIIRQWRRLIMRGRNQSHFDDRVQTIKEISAAELQELANKYLLPETFYEVVVY